MRTGKGEYGQMRIEQAKRVYEMFFAHFGILFVLVSVCLCSNIAFAGDPKEALGGSDLLVHLPREISVETSRFNLGQIGIIQGKSQLCEKADKITLGRISLPGQKVSIDRAVILSRLASNGISGTEVTITGAEKTVVTQKHNIIESEQIIEAAKSFLSNRLSSGSLREIKAVTKPDDMLIPRENERWKLSTRLLSGAGKKRARVRVQVVNGDTILGTRLITLRMKYNRPRAVASVQIPAGTMLTRDNVSIEQVVSDTPGAADWKPPYGSIARRAIDANSVIASDMLRTERAEVVIKRNETVSIRVEMPGLLVSALGKALQKGRSGEYIKVRNVDSRRIILVKVAQDGTVRPVF